MTFELRYRVDSKGVHAALARAADALPSDGDFTPATLRMARHMKTSVQLRFRTMRAPDGQPWQKSRRAEAEGGQTLSLTRRLRNSITSAWDRLTATVGTNVIYAAIHQFGGIIRAKKGPFLAIPITAEARAAGSPRNMPGLHVWQTVRGPQQATGGGQYVMGDDRGRVHFLLRTQVVIPKRPFLGVSDSDKTELSAIVQSHLQGAWNRG
jgi:phage virion morphogenesis protein